MREHPALGGDLPDGHAGGAQRRPAALQGPLGEPAREVALGLAQPHLQPARARRRRVGRAAAFEAGGGEGVLGPGRVHGVRVEAEQGGGVLLADPVGERAGDHGHVLGAVDVALHGPGDDPLGLGAQVELRVAHGALPGVVDHDAVDPQLRALGGDLGLADAPQLLRVPARHPDGGVPGLAVGAGADRRPHDGILLVTRALRPGWGTAVGARSTGTSVEARGSGSARTRPHPGGTGTGDPPHRDGAGDRGGLTARGAGLSGARTSPTWRPGARPRPCARSRSGSA